MGACVLSALFGMPAPSSAAQATQPDHHPDHACAGWTAGGSGAGGDGAKSIASNAKLDELVKKMNSAKGAAKVDAMAELLTILVNDHRTMGGRMASMTSMLNMMSMMNMHKMGTAGMQDRMTTPPDQSSSSPEPTQPKE
jgi:hypothetical protein